MKDIIYYIRKKQPPFIQAMNDAGIAGLKNVGLDFEIKYEDKYEPSEIAVLFGFHKQVSPSGRIRKIIYDSQAELGKKVLVLERGFLDREVYHSVGWNGINGRADFNNLNRPHDRLKKLNLEIKPWKEDGEILLVCGQVPWDSNVQHINQKAKKGADGVSGYLGWLRDLILELMNNKKNHREIIFRPHPLFGRLDYYKEVLPKEVRWSDCDLKTDLSRAWSCHAFNSNTIVEAIVEGVHGFAYDAGSVAFSKTNKTLKHLKNPILLDREQWLADIAYAQWTLEEISQGLFWEPLNEKR